MNFVCLHETFAIDRGRPNTDTPRFQHVPTIICTRVLFFYSNGYKQGYKQLSLIRFLLERTKHIVCGDLRTILTDTPTDTNRYPFLHLFSRAKIISHLLFLLLPLFLLLLLLLPLLLLLLLFHYSYCYYYYYHYYHHDYYYYCYYYSYHTTTTLLPLLLLLLLLLLLHYSY